MSDSGYGNIEDRSITITTSEGRTITWKPRSDTFLPQCPPALTLANSPISEHNPESWSNGSHRYSGFVSSSGNITIPNQEGEGKRERGNEIEKVQHKFRTLKSKFTHRLCRCSLVKRTSVTEQQIFTTTTSPHNIALPTRRTRKGVMNRLRDFWKPVNETEAERKPNKLVKKERTRNQFTHKSGATSDPESTLADDRTYKQILEIPLVSTKPIMIQKRHSDKIDGSMSCQPPSALDCAHTRRNRHFEEQARELIISSYSTTDEHLGEQVPNPECKHKSLRSCCKCEFLGNKGGWQNQERDPDPSGQGAGNIGTPEDAEYLVTYSESEESLVNISVESPAINNSLVLRKTSDLRELDSYLRATGQVPGNIHLGRFRTRQAVQTQGEAYNEIEEADAPDQNKKEPEMPPPLEDLHVSDDEISDLDIIGSSSPFFHSFDGQVLRKRLRHLPKPRTSVFGLEPNPESETDLVPRDSTEVDKILEKTLSLNINEPATVRIRKNWEEKKKIKDITVEEELEEAMNTPLPEPKDGKVAQAIVIRGGARKYAVPAINSYYVNVSTGDYLSPSAKYLCAAHPLNDNDNIEYHSGKDSPPSPRIGNYPALDSSATSIDFGFRPTLETMSGSWPDESEYVNLTFEPETKNKEGKTWRDYSATDLPMGQVDTHVSPFARCREVKESCHPPIEFGRNSEESVRSVKAH